MKSVPGAIATGSRSRYLVLSEGCDRVATAPRTDLIADLMIDSEICLMSELLSKHLRAPNAPIQRRAQALDDKENAGRPSAAIDCYMRSFSRAIIGAGLRS